MTSSPHISGRSSFDGLRMRICGGSVLDCFAALAMTDATLDKAHPMLYRAISTENSVLETPAHKREIWRLP